MFAVHSVYGTFNVESKTFPGRHVAVKVQNEKEIEKEEGKDKERVLMPVCALQFLNTKSKSLIPNYFRGAHAFILMFDVTNPKSFKVRDGKEGKERERVRE